jgi:hypothetical protein
MLAPGHFFRRALAHSILNMNHKSSSIRYLGRCGRREAEAQLWHWSCLIEGMTNDKRKDDKDHLGENQWRNLCKKVADEPDPQRLSELVDQLIKVLDARRQKNQQDGVDPSSTFGSTS